MFLQRKTFYILCEVFISYNVSSKKNFLHSRSKRHMASQVLRSASPNLNCLTIRKNAIGDFQGRLSWCISHIAHKIIQCSSMLQPGMDCVWLV